MFLLGIATTFHSYVDSTHYKNLGLSMRIAVIVAAFDGSPVEVDLIQM
jgi:hypothetical protein